MSIETATNPAVDEDVASEVSQEVETQETEAEQEDVTDESDAETEEVAADDVEDVEYEGKQYKLPKELREALLRQQDYTRKTQEVAEQRKAIARREAELVQSSEIQAKTLEHRAKLHGLNVALKRYENVDWQAVEYQYGADVAQSEWRSYQLLKEEKERATETLTKAEQIIAEDAKRKQASYRQEFVQSLNKIKGWDAEADKSVTKAFIDAGFDAEEIQSLDDPRLAPLIDLMLLGLKARAVQQAPAPKEKQEFKPVRKVNAPAPAGKDPHRMTDEEWVKWREGQIKDKSRRR